MIHQPRKAFLGINGNYAKSAIYIDEKICGSCRFTSWIAICLYGIGKLPKCKGLHLTLNPVLVFSCYTDFVLKNVTITLTPEAALWARIKAAEANTSMSRFIGKMIEEQQAAERRPVPDEAYWEAYRQWKSRPPLSVEIDAANRLTREEANARR